MVLFGQLPAFVLLLWTAGGIALAGQDGTTFSSGVKVVSLLANVMSRGGALNNALSKEDFAVMEDGRPQTIRYFSRESDLPLTLGLMVDTSMSQQKVLDAERGASYRFLDQVLREKKDQIFILQFDMAVQLRQGLTDSRAKLDDALSFVDTPTRSELRVQSGGGTLLYDAVMKASKDLMASRQGRKALIILSDGVDTGSEATLNDAVEAAQRADTLIYSILFSDSGAYGFFGGGHDGRKVLQRLANESGGGFFEVSKKQSIDQTFGLIENELRSQYSLGYISDKPVRISEFRKIQLTTKASGLTVQSRTRYWARP
jgi:VWFA-related protein